MRFDNSRYLASLPDSPDTRAVPRTEEPGDPAAVRRLSMIVDHLRGDFGCPFDRKLTLEALVSDLKDEVFELEEAVLKKETGNIAKEMGDLFLILFMARRILWDQSGISLGSILDSAAAKMVTRHPHVFEEHNPEKTLEAIWETWEETKRKEPEHRDRQSVMDGIPATMPALSVAAKQGQKASRVGFDWATPDAVLSKVEEEWQEILDARTQGPERLAEEIGDMFFALAQYSRHMGIRPEEALARANRKFRDRFSSMEQAASVRNIRLSELDPAGWESLWNAAKAQEKAPS